MDRADAAEARRGREAAELLRKPIPAPLKLDRWELTRKHAAAAEVTPASKGDLGRLEQVVTQLKGGLVSWVRLSPRWPGV